MGGSIWETFSQAACEKRGGTGLGRVGYLWNLTSTRILPDNKTPFEMLHGYKPDLSHLRVFGCRCFSRIPPERRAKNGPHSSLALFMGYPDGIKGWRLRDCATGTFFNSRDVVFDEGSSAADAPQAELRRSTRPRVLTEKGKALALQLQIRVRGWTVTLARGCRSLRRKMRTGTRPLH